MNSTLSAIQQALKNVQVIEEAPSGYNRQPQPAQTGTAATLQRFVEMLAKVGGEGHILDGEEAVISVLRRLLSDMRGYTALLPLDPELVRLGIGRLLTENGLTILEPSVDNLESAALGSLGITTAQAGLADTGTVVLVHTQERGRLAALLAPIHLVFLKISYVYLDKVTFLAEAKPAGMDLASTPITWVTGPSLTADIEKVLVRGAHGPRRVVVILY
jgi:L-lactate dehydrogenase complex protein LldG